MHSNVSIGINFIGLGLKFLLYMIISYTLPVASLMSLFDIHPSTSYQSCIFISFDINQGNFNNCYLTCQGSLGSTESEADERESKERAKREVVWMYKEKANKRPREELESALLKLLTAMGIDIEECLCESEEEEEKQRVAEVLTSENIPKYMM